MKALQRVLVVSFGVPGVAAPERVGDLALKMFGPNRGVDLELAKHTPHEPVDLSE